MELTPLEGSIVQKTGIKENSREALEQYQLNKLKETIAYARKNSAFYCRHLSEVQADAVQSIKDIGLIPFTFPHHLSQAPFEFTCVPHRDVSRIVTLSSSGTSSEKKNIF